MIKITWGFKRSHLVRRVDFPHHGCWLLVQILPPWQIGGAAQILFDFSTNMIAMEIFYTYLEGTYPLGIFWNQFKFGWEKYYTTLMSKVWGSNCRKALSLKGTIKKRRKIWMRSWSVVNEGKRSAKTSFGWKRRFVRERPTTARRPSPPRARGDAFICFLMWAGGADQKRPGLFRWQFCDKTFSRANLLSNSWPVSNGRFAHMLSFRILHCFKTRILPAE